MTSYIPASLRKLVADRAGGLCEYSLLHEDDTFFGCQIEHVIAQKHGGATTAENLAFACVFCNQHKGSDIASIAAATKQLTRLFHPRTDHWADHFALASDGVTLAFRSDIGQVTIDLLQLNHPDRIIERQALRAIGRYRSQGAAARILRR
ncbi:MAG TPA: HNH endonuclease signature motif containing protein [Tepidisphaeraceae bacterium]|nr:HNH endonuclease signature motif containing protein [Tepidisphaeraceae bacterium]